MTPAQKAALDLLKTRLFDRLWAVEQISPFAHGNPPSMADVSRLTRVVDEVVRQMEWVREECLDLIGGAAEDSHNRIWELHLTIAEPGWRPRT